MLKKIGIVTLFFGLCYGVQPSFAVNPGSGMGGIKRRHKI